MFNESPNKLIQKRIQALPQASLPPPTMLARPFPRSVRFACASLFPVLPHTPWPLERLGHWNAFALGTPWHTIPHHTIPYHTTPHHTIPCQTTPYHTIPHHPFQSNVAGHVPPCGMSCHTRLGPWNAFALGTPWHTIPYHNIPYHTTPHHTTQCHTTPYHTTPHHPFQFLSIPIPFHPHSTQYMQTAGPTQMPAEGTALTSLK